MEDDDRLVRPDGLAVRRRRHERGWSPRDLIDAVATRAFESTGLRRTITPNLLIGIEEHAEEVPYGTLCLLASALDCDPVDLWSDVIPDEGDADDAPDRENGGARRWNT